MMWIGYTKDKVLKILKENMMLAITFGLVLGVVLFWCCQKSDMFIDEIFSYGLSNSFNAPFITDLSETGSVVNTVLKREDFIRYLTVYDRTEAFRFDSVYYNQTQDVHPPLYYMLLHLVCSVFCGQYSKWLGLSINIICYAGIGIILYCISRTILNSKNYAVLTVLIYGLSWGGLSTVLMIRMYALLTLLTLLFLYTVIKLYNGEIKLINYFFVFILIFLGMFTQYFFSVFAFFISAAYCLHLLLRKNMKGMISYAVCAVMGVIVFVLSYPCLLDQYLHEEERVAGSTVMENLGSIKGMMLDIYSCTMQIAAGFKPLLLILMISFFVGIFLLKGIIAKYKMQLSDFIVIDMGIAVLLTVLLTAIVSPVNALRYFYNIFPVIVLVSVYFIKTVWEELSIRLEKEHDACFLFVYIFCMLLCIYRSLTVEPQFVNNLSEEQHEAAILYADRPCVYLDNGFQEPLTKDMLDLVRFNEVYVSNDFFGESAHRYLAGRECDRGIVLYIDTAQDRSGFDPEKILAEIFDNTAFDSCDLLFEDTFSTMYYISM